VPAARISILPEMLRIGAPQRPLTYGRRLVIAFRVLRDAVPLVWFRERGAPPS